MGAYRRSHAAASKMLRLSSTTRTPRFASMRGGLDGHVTDGDTSRGRRRHGRQGVPPGPKSESAALLLLPR